MPVKTPLYFHSLNYGWPAHQKFLREHMKEFSNAGKFHAMVPRIISDNMLIPRWGLWTLPWETTIIPGYEMPAYDSDFKKTFAEITDERGLEVKRLVNEGIKPSVFYSGGIDSVVCVTSLLKNLTDKELQNVTLVLSYDSLIENPMFYDQHIRGKFAIADSNARYFSDMTCPITLDQGDSLFGTELGTKMYAKFRLLLGQLPGSTTKQLEELYYHVSDKEVHYSRYEELLVHYFSISNYKDFAYDKNFGELFYRKVVKNIETSQVPIHSLHDVFWWMIFNIKYMHCAVRSSLYYGRESKLKSGIMGGVFNWFGSSDYQKWSMANNNNGQKINGTTQPRYKWAARKYIHDFDKNDWTLHYKLKVPSLKVLSDRNFRDLGVDQVFGIDHDFRRLLISDNDVQEFMLEGLKTYKIDW